MKLLVQSKYEPMLVVTICFKSVPRIQQRISVDKTCISVSDKVKI